jgi:hypothetical protein
MVGVLRNVALLSIGLFFSATGLTMLENLPPYSADGFTINEGLRPFKALVTADFNTSHADARAVSTINFAFDPGDLRETDSVRLQRRLGMHARAS